MHAVLPRADRSDRAAAVPRRGQRLVLLLDQLHLRTAPSSAACRGMLVELFAHPRHIAGIIPPTVRHSFPDRRAEWREDLQPRYRAAVADAEGRVETLPVADLPALIDELADARRRVLRLDRGVERCRIQDGDEPRAVLPAPPAPLARRQPPAARSPGFESAGRSRQRPRHRVARLVARPVPVEATATDPGRDARPRGRGKAGGRGGGVRRAGLVAAPTAGLPPPAGRRPAPRPDSGGADGAS